MKYILFTILLLFLITRPAFSQNESAGDSIFKLWKKNLVYLEAGGQGGFYSIGYDRIYDYRTNKKRTVSIGFSYITPAQLKNFNIFSATLSTNTVFHDYFELGFGITPMQVKETVTLYNPGNESTEIHTTSLFFISPKIGLRFQRRKGGLFFRAAFTPLISLHQNNYTGRVVPWLGVSLGYSF